MTRSELKTAVTTAKNEIRKALQTMYDAMNHGQQKQIVKDKEVKTLFDRYDVVYSE